ncbi:MAG: sulfurtransferase [Caldilineaceae bacterium SB0661_bin_32]|uniref:Sulfurtransferase n=1 Tax=Caldilineaceae bacterium SB0661_bin_32 TaxID=2605255 RepID=A0A6B1D9S8_9CHLR|nr:sulfurtransferase [Caldilineaceae bacterium SB0661_bin_32]
MANEQERQFRTLISCSQLANALAATDDSDTSNLRIVDCRFDLGDTEAGRRAYIHSHIPGAAYAHLDEDMSGPILPGRTGRHPLPDPHEFALTLARLGISNNAQVALYDASGGSMASRMWWMLRWVGHEAAAVLDGGWDAWTAAGLPTRSGVESSQPGSFSASPRPELVVDAAEMLAKTASGGALVIDARAADRFRGENETHDPIGGHIPGASNLPHTGNLHDGLFRDPAELAARFSELMGNRPPSEVIFYCGSGVSACHNALALKHAGIGEARLYPGSWSDWITDPARPTSQG